MITFRNLTKQEKKDYNNSVIVMKTGRHETLLTQKDIKIIIKELKIYEQQSNLART